MNKLSILGKFLDQPRLVGSFSKAVPTLLVGGAIVFTHNHVKNTPKPEKLNELIKSISVLTGTIGSALIATRGIKPIKLNGKTIFKGFEGLSQNIDLKSLTKQNVILVNDYLKNNTTKANTTNILNKAKSQILSLSEVKRVFGELNEQKQGKEFLNKLIPNPENIDSKHIFSEIGRLSLMGLVPVLGGIAGGIVGDKLTDKKNWKEKIPNKIKEGSYQYLANIFLCNIGAGVALALLEKAKITSKSARALGMIGGILTFGVIGGSAIANLIGKKVIDPVIEKRLRHSHRLNPQKAEGNHSRPYEGHHGRHHNCKNRNACPKRQGLYSERKPEAMDIGLHADDIATVAVLSGLKWIEPALPILYSISGYRAGIGYRNNSVS